MKKLIFASIVIAFFLFCEKSVTPPPPVEQKGILEGVVKDQDSQQPVAGTIVRALNNQVADTTDSTGRFLLEGLSLGTDSLIVIVPGYFILRKEIEIAEALPQLTFFLTALQTRVTLENQSEHSGIMVELLELDTFAVTDSTGKFILQNIPDGEYTMRAGYPYFSFAETKVLVQNGIIQTPVNMELKQLLQFWVEPSETTLSALDLSTLTAYLFVKNITDTIVTIGGYSSPEIFVAFEPQGFDWPLDSVPNLCERRHGTFVNGDLTVAPGYSFLPSVTKSFQRQIPMDWGDSCFQRGTYLLFLGYTDLSRFPRYFDSGRYLWNDSDPRQPVYEQMNKSLYKKQKLFRPATILVTE